MKNPMGLLVTALTLALMPQVFAKSVSTPTQVIIPPVENAVEPAAMIKPDSNAAVSTVVIPPRTTVRFALDSAISSRTAVAGSQFQLKVSEDLVIDGVVVIPTGTPATGEIIHSQKSSVFGKAGELLLTIRYIDLRGQKIKMRSFQPYQGKDTANAALGASLAIGMFAAFIRGGEVVMPESTLVQALVAAETSIDVSTNPGVGNGPSPAIPATQKAIDDTTASSDSATLPTGDSQ